MKVQTAQGKERGWDADWMPCKGQHDMWVSTAGFRWPTGEAQGRAECGFSERISCLLSHSWMRLKRKTNLFLY